MIRTGPIGSMRHQVGSTTVLCTGAVSICVCHQSVVGDGHVGDTVTTHWRAPVFVT